MYHDPDEPKYVNNPKYLKMMERIAALIKKALPSGIRFNHESEHELACPHKEIITSFLVVCKKTIPYEKRDIMVTHHCVRDPLLKDIRVGHVRANSHSAKHRGFPHAFEYNHTTKLITMPMPPTKNCTRCGEPLVMKSSLSLCPCCGQEFDAACEKDD